MLETKEKDREFRLKLKNAKGTYAVIAALEIEKHIRVGKLGTFCFQPGFYGYIGSAFGPGGILTRISHHMQITPKPHWHMDYFRKEAFIKEVWVSYDQKPLEHVFANVFLRMDGSSIPAKGFGSSDCRCVSHLFHFHKLPDAVEFEKELNKEGFGCQFSVFRNEGAGVFQILPET
jgi:Uri superfamily endonuclease